MMEQKSEARLYHIAGNFCMVQIFVVFMDRLIKANITMKN